MASLLNYSYHNNSQTGSMIWVNVMVAATFSRRDGLIILTSLWNRAQLWLTVILDAREKHGLFAVTACLLKMNEAPCRKTSIHTCMHQHHCMHQHLQSLTFEQNILWTHCAWIAWDIGKGVEWGWGKMGFIAKEWFSSKRGSEVCTQGSFVQQV